MERVATDVAKPSVPGGELPSFEELLAKGSFHARLAQARLKREKALAESGDAGGFILDTTCKPWERDLRRSGCHDPLVSALGNSAAVDDAAPAGRGPGAAATLAARPDGGLSAKIVPIRRGNVLWLEFPVAPDGGAGAAAGVALPRREAAVPDRSRAAIAPPAVGPVPVVRPMPAVRRAATVGGGFLSGLLTGAAVMMALPYHGGAVAPTVLTGPSTRIVAPDVMPPRPATGSGTASSGETAAVLAPGFQAAPDGPGDTSPGIPAPIAGLAAGSLPALAPAVTGTPETAPASSGMEAAPAVPARLDRAPALVQPDATAAASRVSLPHPDVQPDVAGAAVLAAVAPSDVLPAIQENPPAAAPRLAAPGLAAPGLAASVILNAPESIGEAELAGLVDRLDAAGFALEEPNRVDIPISESNVRFFHPEDAAAAGAVASRLGARLRDFTSFAPSPPAGTIEVWLSGHGNPAAPAKTRRASGQRTMTAEDRELNLLRDRILQQLRNGEHL